MICQILARSSTSSRTSIRRLSSVSSRWWHKTSYRVSLRRWNAFSSATAITVRVISWTSARRLMIEKLNSVHPYLLEAVRSVKHICTLKIYWIDCMPARLEISSLAVPPFSRWSSSIKRSARREFRQPIITAPIGSSSWYACIANLRRSCHSISR